LAADKLRLQRLETIRFDNRLYVLLFTYLFTYLLRAFEFDSILTEEYI